MRPALLAAAVGRSKPALFPVTGRGSLEEGNHAFLSFLAAVEVAIRVNERAFAQLVLLLPPSLARLEFLAGPALAVGMAIEIFAEFHDAAVVVDHNFVGVHLRGREVTPSSPTFAFLRETGCEMEWKHA